MMNTMNVLVLSVQRMGVAFLFMAGVSLVSCSSTPEPQPEPSKEEIRKDADRFFKKIEKEETQSQNPE
jgi:hypothetical protein